MNHITYKDENDLTQREQILVDGCKTYGPDVELMRGQDGKFDEGNIRSNARTVAVAAVKLNRRLQDTMMGLSVLDTDDRIFREVTFMVESEHPKGLAWLIRQVKTLNVIDHETAREEIQRRRLYLVETDLAYKLAEVLNKHWEPQTERYNSKDPQYGKPMFKVVD